MIYELAVVAQADQNESQIATLTSMVREVVKSHDGDLYIEDDWGVLSFAQPTAHGVRKGHYLYFLYRANNQNNAEIIRRLKINEGIIKYLIIKLGEEKHVDKIIKGHRSPYSKKYQGSVLDSNTQEQTDDMDVDIEKDRRNFARRKSCWFTAKKIRADWKDPGTYSWLISEFGKISPARISGISAKHQRIATQTIKIARQLGLCSHLSGRLAQ
jgi:small subunit ribosomal protein S6